MERRFFDYELAEPLSARATAREKKSDQTKIRPKLALARVDVSKDGKFGIKRDKGIHVPL